jgi:arginine repressor
MTIKIPGDYQPTDDEEPEIANGLPKPYVLGIETAQEKEQRKRATDDEMIARQEKVANYKTINPNIDLKKLQEYLAHDGISVSLNTISRDVREIENSAWNWSSRLAISGFVWDCQEACKRNDNMIATLYKHLTRSDDPKDISTIARTINELQMSKLNLEGRVTYLRLRKARDKYMSAEAIAEARRE